MERILEEEEKFDFSILEKAIEERVAMNINNVMKSTQTVAEVDVVTLPDVSDVVIDIRHPDEREKAPLTLTNNEIKEIAFYELMSSLDQLDANQTYLLYCEKGTMSQLHASHLKGMGYEQVKVYMPA